MGNLHARRQKTPIEEFVDKVLSHSKINIGILPDSFERAIYVSIFTRLTENLEEVLRSVELRFMNKKVTFCVEDID